MRQSLLLAVYLVPIVKYTFCFVNVSLPFALLFQIFCLVRANLRCFFLHTVVFLLRIGNISVNKALHFLIIKATVVQVSYCCFHRYLVIYQITFIVLRNLLLLLNIFRRNSAVFRRNSAVFRGNSVSLLNIFCTNVAIFRNILRCIVPSSLNTSNIHASISIRHESSNKSILLHLHASVRQGSDYFTILDNVLSCRHCLLSIAEILTHINRHSIFCCL